MKLRIVWYFIFMFLCLQQVFSQIQPLENATVNYRIIGFSYPSEQIAGNYSIEIAEGNYSDEGLFMKNIVVSLSGHKNRMIAEVPDFGKQYTWRTICVSGHSKIISSPFHHFSTGIVPSVDTNVKRLRILTPAKEHADAYIFLDNSRVLYDLSGHPVWYLPDIGKLTGEYLSRAFHLTSSGSLTLIGDENGYEIDYNGKIIWKTPHDSEKHYHHEFTKLSNGHYMVLGAEMTDEYLSDDTANNQSGLIVVSHEKNDKKPQIMPGWHFNKVQQYPEIIEYDKDGKQVWEYKSSSYFNRSDLFFHKGADGKPDTKVHDNAFYLDEKAKELYISCKNISRIIKVKYPEGTTIDAYGEKYAPAAVQNRGSGFFCGQHNCTVSDEGYLCIYNNNDCNPSTLPSVILLRQPVSQKDSLKKVWEYACTIDESLPKERSHPDFKSGGSVYELPDNSLLVNMGGLYSKVFIINRNKEILWSALPEKWQPDLGKWLSLSQYRAGIILDREELEKFIWSGQQSK